jgi:oligopeptide/dipeptide ABC transporter ATP-binding protein
MHEADGLRVDGLTVGLRGREVVRNVSFAVGASEAYGLVGESGSGKSMTCRAILGLLPAGAVTSGQIRLGETSLLELSPRQLKSLRGSAVGMVFQDPMAALNPVLRVGRSIAQVIRSHERVDRAQARTLAIAAMKRVGIRDAERRAQNYPHQFSGGMRQRIVIAMALAARPRLLLADEPTTALDVIVQAGILRLLDNLRRDEAMSLLLVSHDLSIIAGMCERVGVMYAGELVEEGPTGEVLSHPRHPYTKALIDSHPEDVSPGRLRSIPGIPPEPGELPPGCAFSPRCEFVTDECRQSRIEFLQVLPGRRSRCIHSDLLPSGIADA